MTDRTKTIPPDLRSREHKKSAVIWLKYCRYGVKHHIINKEKTYQLNRFIYDLYNYDSLSDKVL